MKPALGAIPLWFAVGLVILSFTGCNWNSTDFPTTLDLAVADTPVDGASSVNIAFTGVQIQPVRGALLEYDFPAPVTVDLLQHGDDQFSLLLDDQPIAPGNYQSVRFLVDMTASNITLLDGSVHPLILTGSDPNGIKISSPFSVNSQEEAAYTVDFDLRRSITLVGGNYHFTPVMRFVNDQLNGAIEGIVAPTFFIGKTAVTDPSCSPAAYIYAGANVTPVDINPSSAVQPVATTTVFLDDLTGNYKYAADFMMPGNYTVTLVCAADDDPNTVDALTFAEPQTAPVSSGFITEVTFP